MTDCDPKPWLTSYPPGLPHTIEPEYTSMLEMFTAAVARMPDAPALLYFDGAVTFRELDERSDALAAALVSGGFAPGGRLALYLQNTPAFVVGLVAAWKAGGAAVALNPMNLANEVQRILADSGATALLALEELHASVTSALIGTEGVAVTTVITCSPLDDQARDDPRLFRDTVRHRLPGTLDLTELTAQWQGRRPPQASFDAGAVAMIIYTSGTVNQQMGARNTHGGMAFNAQTYRDWMGLTAADRILGLAPLFHVTGLVGHIAVSFLTGAPLILNYRFDGPVLLDAIREHRPTFTVGAITAFNALTSLPGAGPADWSSFRVIYSGGAAIPPAVSERFRQLTGLYPHNIYGLTETNSPSHAVPLGLSAPADPETGALSVGVPVFNTTARVIDDAGQAVAAGEVGEIVISGPQVIPGYWGDPESAIERLVDGEIRTGDIGFMDPQGWFYVVDRKKDMINASGYKVWPREVEDVLYGHPDVAQVAVVGVPDEYRGETVKAFIVLQPGARAGAEEIIAFAKGNMAAYKYPRAVEFLDEIPKNAAGKVLRRELRRR